MNCTTGTVVPGHGVASGKNGDPRFPGGTISMQVPFFASSGLDLSSYHPATINLSIAPDQFEIGTAFRRFENLKWHPEEPAEDFSFFECHLKWEDGGTETPGLIYYPHPETKPEHFQEADILEVLTRDLIEGLTYGSKLILSAAPEQIRFLCGDPD